MTNSIFFLLFHTWIICLINCQSQLEYKNKLEEDVSKNLMKNINADNIRNNLRQLTKKPHRAGTQNNNEVGDWISEQWKNQGLENVHFKEYDVLLSEPENYDRPNTVELFDGNGKLIFKSIGQMPPLIPEEQSDYGANATFNAYSASGSVIGNLIYANYGTITDFEYLEKRGITIKGKIVLIRYGGGTWRGNKVANAQTRGAIGVVLYSDPAEVCPNVKSDNEKYPYTTWMPKGGVQLGSLLNTQGDPLTPLYPALDYVYRSKSISDIRNEGIMPSIPVQPISYADAYEFLSRMKGETAPQNWQGQVNVTYKIDQGQENWKVRLTVNADTSKRKIRNLIGRIEGSREPDRYVIIGNHYDAWIYGGIDPSSATAVMLELSRSFMLLVNETGWRPLRTIIFCAWDAEEQSLIGSTEWIEDQYLILDRRLAAYLNLDLISGNDSLVVDANPTLHHVAVTAAKRVRNPRLDELAAGRKTVFDTWINRQPDIQIPGFPIILDPHGGSDHTMFFQHLGAAVLNFDYTNDMKFASYPLYHTLYETAYVNENLMDQNFAVHVAVGQLLIEMTRLLADSDVLPLNIDHYGLVLQKYVNELNGNLMKAQILPNLENVARDMESLQMSLTKMKTEVEKFYHYANQLDVDADKNKITLELELVNSRLQQVERCFIIPKGGDPSIPFKRHVVFSTANDNAYASSVLIFIYAQIGKFQLATTEKIDAINELRQQISIFHYSIDCVINLLEMPKVKKSTDKQVITENSADFIHISVVINIMINGLFFLMIGHQF